MAGMFTLPAVGLYRGLGANEAGVRAAACQFGSSRTWSPPHWTGLPELLWCPFLASGGAAASSAVCIRIGSPSWVMIGISSDQTPAVCVDALPLQRYWRWSRRAVFHAQTRRAGPRKWLVFCRLWRSEWRELLEVPPALSLWGKRCRLKATADPPKAKSERRSPQMADGACTLLLGFQRHRRPRCSKDPKRPSFRTVHLRI